jgi:hypothetical protein
MNLIWIINFKLKCLDQQTEEKKGKQIGKEVNSPYSQMTGDYTLKPKKLHPKTHGHHKQPQQSNRIQN